MTLPLLIIGECLSKSEEAPFTDGNGKMFRALLRRQGIEPRECKFLNVFPEPGPLYRFFGGKSEGQLNIRFLERGKYIRQEYWHHVTAIREQVNQLKPNLVLAVGDAALWALTSDRGIAASRGRITFGNSALPKQKILPVYSPRQVQIDYTQRPILIADLEKARREQESHLYTRPRRLLHISPTLDDLEFFLDEYIRGATRLSIDIETKPGIITCVGVAPSASRAIVVPFYSEASPNRNYWPTVREEFLAWSWIKRVLRLPIPTVGQNYQYDAQYLWRDMGLPALGFAHDTMILHHALQPEMKKALGFQASIYTDEPAWKQMRHTRADDKTVKKDDQ